MESFLNYFQWQTICYGNLFFIFDLVRIGIGALFIVLFVKNRKSEKFTSYALVVIALYFIIEIVLFAMNFKMTDIKLLPVMILDTNFALASIVFPLIVGAFYSEQMEKEFSCLYRLIVEKKESKANVFKTLLIPVAAGTLLAAALYLINSFMYEKNSTAYLNLSNALFQNYQLGKINFQNILVLFLLSLNTEILFRLGIQTTIRFKTRSSNAIWSILISTLIYLFAFKTSITQNWPVYLEVIPLGIVTGYVYENLGIEASILTQWSFRLVYLACSALFIATAVA